MRYKIFFLMLAAALLGAVIFSARYTRTYVLSNQSGQKDGNADTDEEIPAAAPVPVTSRDLANSPNDTSALAGFNVLIADRGNNRLLEVSPDKKIVWQYNFSLPKLGLGADDAFYTDGGKSVIVNLEEYHIIQIIDYASKQVIWSYGVPGKPGNADGMLNTPDDAYKLPNGNVIAADIKNCRVVEISPDKHIVRQYGKTKKCGNKSGLLNAPNGDTPLPNGHVLISNIIGKNLVELDNSWQIVFSMPLPVKYPSDPQATKAGNILISDYSKPGQVVEVSKQGQIVWQFDGQAGDAKLNKPSLAIELPNGNILCNDDSNHRVIVIDKQTKKIVWQYGVTGKPGESPGQLNIPDGVDIIMRGQSASAAKPPGPVLAIGQVSRHPQTYANQQVTVSGYVLKQQNGYAIFSDERAGSVGPYDLPVSGPGVDGLAANQQYTLRGTLKYQGLDASNHNPYHLEGAVLFNNN